MSLSSARAALAAACIGLSPAAVMAQGADDFPSRPITVVVPSDGAGTVNTEVRLFAESVKEASGKPIIVENKGGAGSTIGTAYVAKSKPDGYTLLAPNAALPISPAIYPGLTYDPVKDFSAVTLLDKHVFILLVHPAAPFRTARQYVAYAKAHPEELNFSTTGIGGVTHLGGALLHYMTGTRVTFIHYKSPAQRLLDVTAGRVHASMTAPLSALPLMKSGKLRALGISSTERIALLPDLPTIAEQGVPGYEYASWVGIVAPAKTPPAVINKLNAMWVASVKDPNVIRKLEADGTLMVGSTPDALQRYIDSETARWSKLIKATNMKIEAE